MTLEILICTIDNGIQNVKNLLLAPINGVSYLISWQHSENYKIPETPLSLIRDDVKIVTLKGKGLSRNRNNALRHASGDICLIADDDCSYKPEYFSQIISVYSNDDTLDFATFRMKHSYEGKHYPSHSFDLKHFEKGYFITSFELSFRRKAIQNKFHFNELFGLGAPVLQSGEENIFAHELITAGINGRYFPIVVVEHDHPTTSSSRVANKGVIMAEGAYIYIAYKWTWTLRLILKAHRLNKVNHLGLFNNLSHLIKGIIYIRKNR